MIPKARLDEVIGQREALKAQLDAITAKEEAARQEQLKAAGKFDELETGLKAELAATKAENERLAKIASEHEAQQKATREATIATLPEAQREYAASLPADKLPGFVAALGNKPAPPKPGEPGVTGATGTATREEVIANIGDKVWYAANKHRL
jgi:hypothetical protein